MKTLTQTQKTQLQTERANKQIILEYSDFLISDTVGVSVTHYITGNESTIDIYTVKNNHVVRYSVLQDLNKCTDVDGLLYDIVEGIGTAEPFEVYSPEIDYFVCIEDFESFITE